VGEPVNVSRMTISVPKAVKAKMDAEEGVNWSAVATRAFEAKLLELLASRKEVHTMNDVIARLTAAAELEANEEYQAGLEAGRAWAKEKATPKQLRRLAKYIEDLEDPDPGFWWEVNDVRWVLDGISATYSLAEAVWPDCKADPPDCKKDPTGPGRFWKQALGDDAGRVEDRDFFRGFGEGAVKLWNEVKDML
jgi:cell pole-organizing protein PopZ